MIKAKFETRLHAFGSACRILIGASDADTPDLFELAHSELLRLESKFSSICPDSIIEQINENAGTGVYTQLDAEARSLFAYVSALWDQSNHLFDPTISVLKDCYDRRGFLSANPDRLQELLKLVGWSGLDLTTRGVYLPVRGMRINLDNCIRPYAVDSVRRLLLRNGVTKALIELGSDVASIGKQSDGANWLVGFRHPNRTHTAVTRLKLNDKGFVVRGNFEHRVSMEGENFGRALSPVDAQPLPGLLSVAVIAENCLTACSAASIARLKTEKAGLHWLERLGLPWVAIDRELHCHGPLAPN